MQDAYIGSDHQQSSSSGLAPLYPQELMHYLVHAGTTLRPHTKIHTLLKHLVMITQNIPGFCHGALYLHEQQHFYRVHLSPSDQEQIEYCRQYPLSETLVDALMNDEHRIGQAYVIPIDTAINQHEMVHEVFASFELTYTTTPTGPYAGKCASEPSESAQHRIAVPLYSDTSQLLGFLLCMPSAQRADALQEMLLLLKLFADQVAALLGKACLHEEMQQHAIDQTRESERLIDHFLITASHELRTPLTSIQGYLELLSEFSNTLSEDMRKYFIDNARHASEELILIVNTIMDASRLDQDKLELKPCSVNLRATIQTTMEILYPIVMKEGRKIEIDVAEQCNVWVDDMRLRQILLNLLNNALKYTPASTKIAIDTEELRHQEVCERFTAIQQAITLPAEQSYIVIKIRDWGPGIAPKDQPRLFTKFMRLSTSLNSVQRGAGLGLYLCRQLTEAMGGYIWVESSGIADEGCTFCVALPPTQPSP